MRASLGILALTAWTTFACEDLPAVEPGDFACVDDTPLADGTLACPAWSYCAAGQCTPRLQCTPPTTTVPGCDPGATRCSIVERETLSAVACVPGALPPAITSTTPGPGCACPDGFACTLLGRRQASGLALFISPPYAPTSTSALPVGTGGILEEARAFRRCLRPCATEADCPALHTCRPAARLTPAVLAGSDLGRDTVGVCMLDLLTSTASATDQLDPRTCGYDGDCSSALGRDGRFCEARVEAVPDHPLHPVGPEGWVKRFAFQGRCAPDSALIDSGRGCIDGGDCKSGICNGSRCARLCDPRARASCPSGQSCASAQVKRRTAAGPVDDQVYLCR